MADKGTSQSNNSNEARFRWFVIQTFTGWEGRVQKAIEHKLAMGGLADKVERVLVPLKKMIEAKAGKQREVLKNVMPGYIFIKMEPDDNLYDLIQKVPGVSAFLGPDGKPATISEAEMEHVFDAIRERSDRQQVVVKFRTGDQVRVTEGPFEGFIGTVTQVDEDKGKLKVSISIFGRNTDVELDVLQVADAVN
ncbi:MAG: transcription termination/antitermination protein NusG [Candidatus Sumerlaeaceae bacterium]|nr:transcription termination/antitermination protein NusG [Candidatus Sumerlaeaceae bacterium]